MVRRVGRVRADGWSYAVELQHPVGVAAPLGRAFAGHYADFCCEGRTITLDVEASDITKSVKAKIRSSESIPEKAQRLVHDGMIMNNWEQLCEYDIQEGSTLHLVLLAEPGEDSTWFPRAAIAAKKASRP